MKKLTFGVLVLVALTSTGFAKEVSINWKGLDKGKIDLGLPLLTIKGSKGFLACGYVNVETCNKTQEACAIVSGVKTHDDMLKAEIKAVSEKAKSLGIAPGMTGEAALDILR